MKTNITVKIAAAVLAGLLLSCCRPAESVPAQTGPLPIAELPGRAPVTPEIPQAPYATPANGEQAPLPEAPLADGPALELDRDEQEEAEGPEVNGEEYIEAEGEAGWYPQPNTGEIFYADGVTALYADQEDVILKFVDAYHRSLMQLYAEDVSHLYAGGYVHMAEFNAAVMDVLIQTRLMQKTDLALLGYSYALEVYSAAQNPDGSVDVLVSEDYIHNFASCPGVDSRGVNAGRYFRLVPGENGWGIAVHRQYDSLNNYLLGHGEFEYPPPLDILPGMEERKRSLLESSEQAVEIRRSLGSPAKDIDYTYGYDREDAVDYARMWVGLRNVPQWAMYDIYGGNCQNFISQALFAGGVPMDYSGASQWKWYGEASNTAQQASGRSASWSGVHDFREYAFSNAGAGLVAAVNAAYLEGEPGDVVIMGINGDPKHSVMITDIITDEYGETADYLVASNSSDLLDFPLSAHYYQQHELIKILGWN